MPEIIELRLWRAELQRNRDRVALESENGQLAL